MGALMESVVRRRFDGEGDAGTGGAARLGTFAPDGPGGGCVDFMTRRGGGGGGALLCLGGGGGGGGAFLAPCLGG